MDILKKTMPFIWMRFGLYLLLGIGIVIYYLLAFLLIGAIGSESSGIGIFGIIILIIGIVIYVWISRYLNYLVKASHVAVIAELSAFGRVPEGVSIVKYGQEQLKKRFATATVFFALDGLVSGAVSQIQRMISAIGRIGENIPGVRQVVVIINLFIGIVLGYVDEAVLSRIFLRKEENAWKGAADGVVLYFENWKAILKNAIGLVIFVVVFYVVGIAALYGLCYAVIGIFVATESTLTFILSLVLGYIILASIKASFVDSWITISVVNKYTSVTVNAQPGFDLYGKAKGWSRSFKKICTNAESDGVVIGGVVAGTAMQGQMMNQPAYNQNQPMNNGQVQPVNNMQQVPQAQMQGQMMSQPVYSQNQPMNNGQVQPVNNMQQVPQAQMQGQMMNQQAYSQNETSIQYPNNNQ